MSRRQVLKTEAEIHRAIDDAIALRKTLTREIWTADEMIRGCLAAANKAALDRMHPTYKELAPHVKDQVDRMMNQWRWRADCLRKQKEQMMQDLGRLNSYTLPKLKERLTELETGSLF